MDGLSNDALCERMLPRLLARNAQQRTDTLSVSDTTHNDTSGQRILNEKRMLHEEHEAPLVKMFGQ